MGLNVLECWADILERIHKAPEVRTDITVSNPWFMMEKNLILTKYLLETKQHNRNLSLCWKPETVWGEVHGYGYLRRYVHRWWYTQLWVWQSGLWTCFYYIGGGGGGGGGWGDMLHRNSFVASFMKLIFITIYAFFLQWYIRLGRSAWNQHWWTGTPSWKTA